MKLLITQDENLLKQYDTTLPPAPPCTKSHTCIALQNGGYYLAFLTGNGLTTKKKAQQVQIVCTKESLVFVLTDPTLIKTIESIQEREDTFTALFDFFLMLTAEDIDHLERLENAINELELGILSTEKPIKSAGGRIAVLRRQLLRTKMYYEHLDVMMECMQDAQNEFGQKACARFTAFTRRLEYLLRTVLELREYVTQVREAFQAKIDLEQNYIMKILTVLTAIFLPLSLIAGWYGMNIKMPEFGWDFGYGFVIALSIIVSILTFIVIKKKRWF